METEKETYFDHLTKKELSKETINEIKAYMESQSFKLKDIPKDLVRKGEYGKKVTEELTRLELFIVEGNTSWEGLAVGFPGKKDDLMTKAVGTPYLRKILYPILDLHHRIQEKTGKRLPCIYFIGNRFSDVFLRKFELLDEVTPHLIILTKDIFQCSLSKTRLPATDKVDSESWTQMKICQQMDGDGLMVPINNGDSKKIRLRYLSFEVPCSEGTENPERLDILGYDDSDRSLVAFELKGHTCGRVELENLYLQGVEHRNWLEKNKMAVKLLFDRGPHGERINTKKRVRLLLGFYGDKIENKIPHLFFEFRKQAKRRDQYIEIDFVRITSDGNDIYLSLFDNDNQSPGFVVQ